MIIVNLHTCRSVHATATSPRVIIALSIRMIVNFHRLLMPGLPGGLIVGSIPEMGPSRSMPMICALRQQVKALRLHMAVTGHNAKILNFAILVDFEG